MAPNVSWGIEIGSGAIKALKLELKDDEPTATEFAIVPHSKVLSTPDLDRDDAMRVALGTLASQHDLSKATVAVSVPGNAAFARFAKLPPVEPKKVPDIVKFEAVQQIPFSLDEVEWDYQTFQSPDSPDVEVGVFAITNQRIKQQMDMLADVGLTPDIVVPGPVAVYNALAYDLEFTERTPGTVLLDIGTMSTDLIVAEAGRVWMRTFQPGGHHFTDALVEAFKLSYPKAERLKKEAQQSKHAKHVVQALRPVLTDLVQKVQESIGYYHSLHPEAKLTRLIGLGSTFQLPGLRKYLKQQLSIDVFRYDEFKRLSFESAVKDEVSGSAAQLPTAYGLALEGLGYETIRINLIPEARVREAMWRRKVAWFGVAAGLALAGSALMFYRPYMDASAGGALDSPPRVIDAAAAEKSRLERQAREAGVLQGGTQPDFTAANYRALLENEPIHRHLLEDVTEMLAYADQRAPEIGVEPGAEATDGRAFEFVALQTELVQPGTPASQAFAGSTRREDLFGGSGRGREESRGAYGRDRGGAETQGLAGDEQPGLDSPRLAIKLEVTTTHQRPVRLINETLQRWLQTHAQQGDAPYRIVVDPASFKLLQQIANPEELGAGESDDEGDRGRESPSFDEDRLITGGGGGTAVGSGGGGAIIPDREGRDSRRGRSSGSVEQLAPLEPPEEPRQATSRFELFWYVILGAEQGQDGGDA